VKQSISLFVDSLVVSTGLQKLLQQLSRLFADGIDHRRAILNVHMVKLGMQIQNRLQALHRSCEHDFMDHGLALRIYKIQICSTTHQHINHVPHAIHARYHQCCNSSRCVRTVNRYLATLKTRLDLIHLSSGRCLQERGFFVTLSFEDCRLERNAGTFAFALLLQCRDRVNSQYCAQ
jgi:hypothetical protein